VLQLLHLASELGESVVRLLQLGGRVALDRGELLDELLLLAFPFAEDDAAARVEELPHRQADECI
jgi:hypothetical protein